MGFIAFGFQRNTWQVKADNPQVITAIVDLFTLFFIHAEEAATAHWGFKGTGDFYDLVVIQNVWVHAFSRTLQRQLFDIVIGITKLVIQAVTDSKHQFREYGSFAIFAQTGNTVTQNGLLDHA